MRGATRRPRPAWVPMVAVLIGAAVAGLAIGLAAPHLLGSSPVTAPAVVSARHGLDGEATWAPGARPAPPINTLRDQSRQAFSLAALRGRPVAIEFFDSHCHAECPLAGRTLAAAEQRLPRSERPVLVVVSVNPLDSPASVRTAVRKWGLASVAPWRWLMGTHAQLARVWRAYHIFVRPVRGDISHTEALYLLDRRGDERSAYLYPYAGQRVAHDMRALAAAGGGRPPRA